MIKKYENGSWNTVDYYREYCTDSETYGAVPVTITAAGEPLIDWTISGNMNQSETPSPSAPVTPQECGERTANLAWTGWAQDFVTRVNDTNLANIISDGGRNVLYYMCSVGYTDYDNKYIFKTNFKESTAYTFSFQAKRDIGSNIAIIRVVYTDETYYTPSIVGTGEYTQYSFTSNSAKTVKYIRSVYSDNSLNIDIDTFMCVEGSTAPSTYIPYGFVLNIESANTTTPVYLGQVETVRRIKKVKLSDFSWTAFDEGGVTMFRAWPPLDRDYGYGVGTMLCSAYPIYNIRTSLKTVDYGAAPYNNTNTNYLVVRDKDYTNASEFTRDRGDVEFWYVLASPQTGVLNEPIRKIGDYADTVSAQEGVTIPTVSGENTVDVDTTLPPSEVELEYKGWHKRTAKLYPSADWKAGSWSQFRDIVRMGKAAELYPVGTTLYETWGDNTSTAWQVMGYDLADYMDSDLTAQGFTHNVVLYEVAINNLRVFDAKEAWLYAETAIPAGTYRFTIPNYDTSYGGNKTYIFTSTAAVPVGGQLTLTWAYNANPTKVQGYSDSTSTTALFDVTIAEWDGETACTDLGAIKLAMADADSTYGKLNHIHRARYGSNNYAQSGIRQWLNSDGASGTWWTPSNIFDRPYDNRNTAGRLNTLNTDLKAVISQPTINCITNNLFETGYSLQTAYTIKDKLFLLTHTELNLSSNPNVGSVLPYYTGAQNADRIKYRADNGNAYHFWLRHPYPSNASYERSVNSSGALNSYYAHNSLGGVSACAIQ